MTRREVVSRTSVVLLLVPKPQQVTNSGQGFEAMEATPGHAAPTPATVILTGDRAARRVELSWLGPYERHRLHRLLLSPWSSHCFMA